MNIDLTRAFGLNEIEDFDAHIGSLIEFRREPDRSELERFLRANPGKTVRDWKGTGPSTPPAATRWETPWHRLRTSEVREAATRSFARELAQNVRRAASRDPGLIWNPLARKYRLRLPTDPPMEVGGHES